MAQSNKLTAKPKKKPGDFKRPKRKVGRKAAPAANVTSVSITSRRICLLEQSALQDKGDAVTHRQLNLSDVLQQMGHYNAHVRKNAVQGLRELAQLHASNVMANIAVVLERFLPLFVDEEAVVREATLQTWKVVVPVLVQGNSLRPFAKLLSMYFNSGLTHLQVGVRQDTLRAIETVLEIAPALLSQENGQDQVGCIIENFRDLLTCAQSQGIKVKNSYDVLGDAKKKNRQNAGALRLRLDALKVAHKLLISIERSDSLVPSVPENLYSQCRFGEFETVLLLRPLAGHNSLSKQDVHAHAHADSGEALSFWQTKSCCLLKSLLNLWIECVEANAGVDSVTMTEESLQHMQRLVESVTVIVEANRWRVFKDTDNIENSDDELAAVRRVVSKLQQQLMTRFPLSCGSKLTGDSGSIHWLAINIALARLGCVFVSRTASNALTNSLSAFVTSAFDTCASRRATDEVLNANSIEALLETLMLLLKHPSVVTPSSESEVDEEPVGNLTENQANMVNKTNLLASFSRFYASVTPKSVAFRNCSQFVMNLLELDNEWPAWSLLLDWARCLSKQLLTLDSNKHLSRQCVRTLCSILKRLPQTNSSAEQDQLKQLVEDLVSFFACESEEIQAPSNKQQVLARISDLQDEQDQLNAIALLFHLPDYPVELVRAVASACHQEQIHFHAKTFAIDLLFQRRHQMDLARLLSFLMSCMFSRSKRFKSDAHERRKLAQHVGRLLENLELGLSLAKLLSSALARQASFLDFNNVETLAELPSLVLCYRTCFKTAGGSTQRGGVEFPPGMVEDACRIFLFVVANAKSDDCMSAAMFVDVVQAMGWCQELFLGVCQELLTWNSEAHSEESLRSQLKTFRVLASQTGLRQCLTTACSSILTWLKVTETKFNDICSADEGITALFRQIRGDLELAGQ